MIIGNSHLKHYCGLHKAAQEYIMQSLKEEWNFETIQLHTYGHTHTHIHTQPLAKTIKTQLHSSHLGYQTQEPNSL